MSDITFFCDRDRHMVCKPYSVANLHRMARDLGIHRCWFHASPTLAHYDMPKSRVRELTARCIVVGTREIVRIIKGLAP